MPNPVVCVYINPPTSDPQVWSELREYIKTEVSFRSCTLGYAARVRDDFLCIGCHSADHPVGLCPFAAISGWHGPQLTTTYAPSPATAPATEHPAFSSVPARRAPMDRRERGDRRDRRPYRGGAPRRGRRDDRQ